MNLRAQIISQNYSVLVDLYLINNICGIQIAPITSFRTQPYFRLLTISLKLNVKTVTLLHLCIRESTNQNSSFPWKKKFSLIVSLVHYALCVMQKSMLRPLHTWHPFHFLLSIVLIFITIVSILYIFYIFYIFLYIFCIYILYRNIYKNVYITLQ